jgi:hypothetical protein
LKPAPTDPDKIAVIVVHGMGEQRPMDTLRGFVRTLWEQDASLFEGLPQPADHKNSDTWSKPDRISGSSELRRITTARARKPGVDGVKGLRTDFFELHWADITADSSWGDFAGWFKQLLWRNPLACEVPQRLLLVWVLLWAITLAVALSSLSTALAKVPTIAQWPFLSFLQWDGWAWVTGALLLAGATVKSFLTTYFGDVARYVSATPRNIKVRQAARERGLKLLKELHATGEYVRIVLVGHSLGSILAHDLLALAWADTAQQLKFCNTNPVLAAIEKCELAGLRLLESCKISATAATTLTREDRGCQCAAPDPVHGASYPQALADYRRCQRELLELLRAEKIGPADKRVPAWLVSDLVTLGSPLSHADFLMAGNGCELQAMTRSREILRCPPVFEIDKDMAHPVIRFRPSWDRSVTQMHHASAFAAVRWTNLHDVAGPGLFLRGDLVSGRLARNFGPGVVDLHVRPRRSAWLGTLFPRLFTHTLYWWQPAGSTGTASDHVLALREAVNVIDDPKVEARLMERLKAELAHSIAALLQHR